MKKILVLLLLMVSTNVFAEWTRVDNSPDGNMIVYIDYETIKKKGNKVKIWSLIDFKTVQKSSYGKYLSFVSRNEYDCEEETRRMLDLYSYSGNMRDGEQVYSQSNIKDEGTSIIPVSIDEVLFKIACSKK